MSLKTKPTRVNNAYDRLKLDILNSELPPGFQAPEPEIAERLGMSRTPVREALLRLEADGLVELVPRRGARIRGMTPHDMTEIYDLLCVLEPLAMRRLCTEDQEEYAARARLLNGLIDDIRRAEKEDDVDAWAQAEMEFRRELIRLCTNRRLTNLLESLFDQMYRGRIVLLRLRPTPQGMADVCLDILRAVEARDLDTAERLMRSYREIAQKAVEEIFSTSRLAQV